MTYVTKEEFEIFKNQMSEILNNYDERISLLDEATETELFDPEPEPPLILNPIVKITGSRAIYNLWSLINSEVETSDDLIISKALIRGQDVIVLESKWIVGGVQYLGKNADYNQMAGRIPEFDLYLMRMCNASNWENDYYSKPDGYYEAERSIFGSVVGINALTGLLRSKKNFGCGGSKPKARVNGAPNSKYVKAKFNKI